MAQNFDKITPVEKDRIENLFISVNGSPQDYAFRGILAEDDPYRLREPKESE